jgi:hypothetical protein
MSEKTKVNYVFIGEKALVTAVMARVMGTIFVCLLACLTISMIANNKALHDSILILANVFLFPTVYWLWRYWNMRFT